MGNAENVMRVAGWFVVGEIIKELGANVSVFDRCRDIGADDPDDVFHG